MLFEHLFQHPISLYFNRHVLGWSQSGELSNVVFLLIIQRLVGALIAVVLSIAIFNVFGYENYFSMSQFLFFVFIWLISGTFLVLLNAVNLLGDRCCYIKYQLCSLLIGLIIAFMVTYYIEKSAIAWLCSIACVQLFFLVTIFGRLTEKQYLSLRRIRLLINSNSLKKIAVFSLPIMVTLFLQWGQNSSYRLIIEEKYSVESLGQIVVGYSVAATAFGALECLATQYYMPLYLTKINQSNKEGRVIAWNNVASYMLPIYLVLMFFVVCLAPFLVRVLVDVKFSSVYVFAMIGAVVEFFRVGGNLIYLVSQSEISTVGTILPYFVGFLVTVIVLSYTEFQGALWMIPIVLSFSYLAVFLILYFNMRKILPIQLPTIKMVKALIFSVPFLLCNFIDQRQTSLASALIVFVAGVYFLFSVYCLGNVPGSGMDIE